MTKCIRFKIQGLNMNMMPDQEGLQEISSQSPVQRSKDDGLPTNNLTLPEPFGKYMLTTDVPFSGIRTTKTRIEPVKSFDNLYKLNGNGKEDNLSSLVSSKRQKALRSKSKVYNVQSSTLYQRFRE